MDRKTTGFGYSYAKTVKVPMRVITIIYSITKFVYLLLLHPEYALSRVISGAIMIGLVFAFTSDKLPAHMKSVLVPLMLVTVELITVILTGGDRIIYIFLMGSAMASFLYVDIKGMTITMTATIAAVAFIVFGLDIYLLGVESTFTTEVFNFLGLCIIYTLIFLLARFSLNNLLKAQREAEVNSKAKSDFLSKMSHEIRTPMNAIIGMTELILREELTATAREHAKTIRQSGDHLLSIINDILDLSKVESGKLELVNEEYLFHSVIQDVISIVKMRMGNPAVRFAAYVQADIPNLLYGDEVRIRQILLNVLSNALKYTKEGHFSIDIYGEKKDEETYVLTIKIKDTGIGIKPDDIENLFDEFAQFDLEKNRFVEGTGLGLAITKNLINLMGGNIEVESVYGEGSEFTITLPQKYMAGEHDSDYSVIDREKSHFIAPDAKVLLVDDIETNLKVGEGLLKLYGISVDTRLSGKDAIEAVTANTYDLVLIDHMMPGMDGVETLKIIRGMGCDLPIIALTANAIVGAREMFLQNGFNDFLSKPIELSKLNDILAKWIQKEKQIKADPASKVEMESTLTIEGIDTARGLSHSGGSIRSYLDTLTVFHKNGIEKTTQLTDCLDSDNLKLYTTYVHALKSACANIGAATLSKEAEALENAGINEDRAFLTKHNDGFIINLKKLLKNIAAAIAANTTDGRIEENVIKEQLTELKAALQSVDVDTIDDISEKLKEYTQASDIGEALNGILQNILIGKYKQAVTQIDKLIEPYNV